MIARRLRDRPEILLCALPVATFLFDLRYHEFWRDETSPILVGRALPWDLFFVQMRVEGIPFLFHALMKVASLSLAPPVALSLVGALGFATLLFGTYRLLLAICGERRRSALITLLFSCTYAYAYELGVVVRSYALGLGLALAAAAYLREGLRAGDRRSVVLGTLAAGLSALLSAHSACAAGGALAAFGLLALARRGGVRLGFPILFALPCFALTFLVAQPFVGRTAEYNGSLSRPAGALLELGLQALVKSLSPNDWWAFDFLPKAPAGMNLVAALRDLALESALVAAAVALLVRAPILVRRSGLELFDVLAVVISWAPLVEIVGRHYWGFYRHHLFFSIPAMVIFAGWAADAAVAPRLAGALRRSWFVLAAPWFLFQIGLAAVNLTLDARLPFADTKTFAALLPRGARVVSDVDWVSVGLLLWRPDLQMSAGNNGGRHHRYLTTDNAWHKRVPVAPLLADACREAPDRVFFAGGRLASVGSVARCLSAIANPRPTLQERPLTWERFSMWRVDCGCVSGR